MVKGRFKLAHPKQVQHKIQSLFVSAFKFDENSTKKLQTP
jgi:hypothetical protein